MMGMRIIGDFGAAIAVPVVVFVLLGQWLDEKYDAGYKFTISAFVLAAVVSGRILYKKAKAYGAEFQSLNDEADEVPERDKKKKNNEKNKEQN